MKIKASGRSALILATGVFVCFAGPSQAAASADDAAATAKSEDIAGAPVAPKDANTVAPLEKHIRIANPARLRWRNLEPIRPPLKFLMRQRQFMDITSRSRLRWPTPMRDWLRRHANRRRQGHGLAKVNKFCKTRRTNLLNRNRLPKPRSSPPISSTMSIARCMKHAARADLVDGLGPGAAAPAAPVAAEAATKAPPGTRPP